MAPSRQRWTGITARPSDCFDGACRAAPGRLQFDASRHMSAMGEALPLRVLEVTPMSNTWRTAWQGQDIVVYRDETEMDRVTAGDIERVVFVYTGTGESPGDLQHAVVETHDDCLIFPAETGFAGRVNFERVDYWAARGCVYWVQQSHAPLPMRLRRGK